MVYKTPKLLGSNVTMSIELDSWHSEPNRPLKCIIFNGLHTITAGSKLPWYIEFLQCFEVSFVTPFGKPSVPATIVARCNIPETAEGPATPPVIILLSRHLMTRLRRFFLLVGSVHAFTDGVVNSRVGTPAYYQLNAFLSSED